MPAGDKFVNACWLSDNEGRILLVDLAAYLLTRAHKASCYVDVKTASIDRTACGNGPTWLSDSDCLSAW